MISRVHSSILQGIGAVASAYDMDFGDPHRHRDGQESAKRAPTIAPAGHHNVLMIGPPGSGKTVYGGLRSC